MALENIHGQAVVALRINNLSGSASQLKLFAYGEDGKLQEVSKELWSVTDEAGAPVEALTDGVLYELRVDAADGGTLDLNPEEGRLRMRVVLAK